MYSNFETQYLNTNRDGNFSEIDIPPEFFQELFNLGFRHEKQDYTPSSFMYISAVREGVKPGCTFSDPVLTEENKQSIEDGPIYGLLQKYSIPAKVHIMESKERVHPIYFVWSDDQLEEQLTDISEGYGDFKNWERDNNPDWARFLGIPEEDIQWWKDEGYETLGDLYNDHDGKIVVESNQAEYHKDLLHFTPHIPRLTEEGIERQIEQAREYINAYREVCERNEVEHEVETVWVEPREWTIEPES